MTTVRAATPADASAIARVERAAFGQEDEARLVAALDAGGYTRISLVAEREGEVIGHVLLSELEFAAPSGPLPALVLAPVAVAPPHQRQGVGEALVRAALELAQQQGCRAVVVLGHPGYYPRFGFSVLAAAGIRSPYQGPHFMAIDFTPDAGSLVGELTYPAPFAELP
ncbi:MAG: N-acetyltransferase [Dehalococcoidia bacterium]|nr:N-acetyltransferase [Dehalococcoidia bacterium]